MKYDFDQIVDRSKISVKYGTPGLLHPNCKLPEQVIPMWIADMDFACCDKILDGIKARVDQLTLGYENPVTAEYLLAVTGWFDQRHHWAVEPQWVVPTSGAVGALGIAIKALTEPGEGVIVQRPVYGPFDATIKSCGRQVVNNKLLYENGAYRMDLADLEEKAKDPANKMLAFCNPHNPSGRVWTAEELEAVAEICRKHGVVIVSDEVHCDIVRRGTTYTPMGKIAPECTITSTTGGKSFNLSGLHLANVLIPNETLRQRFSEQRGRWFPSPLAAAATKAAYAFCADWEDQVNDYLDESFAILRRRLPQVLPKARLVEPEGMFLAWIDMHGYDMPDQEICRRFVEDAGVVPDPGTHFGPEGQGFVRLNIACPHAVLNEALDRVGSAFSDLQ